VSEPLPIAAIEQLAQHVERRNLESMRVVTEAPGRFVPALFGTGAMTFGKYVLFRGGKYDALSAKGLALIAHESLHIAQYREMGVPRFLLHYVWGAIRTGFKHDAHPMERELVRRQREIRRALSG
jgi:hypothetical protein